MKYYVIELCCCDCKRFIDFSIFNDLSLPNLIDLLRKLHNENGSLYRIYNEDGLLICDVY